MEGVEAMEQSQAPAAPELPVLAVPILQTVQEGQSMHGLKHQEFSRYRQYCSRRLRRIYKGLKFLHGRTKYQKKQLDAASITDVRHLHIPLVAAERAWAHAMDLKNDAEAGGGGATAAAHSRRRLAKAAAHASELAQLAGARCDADTAAQAAAYAAMLQGGLAAERGVDWTDAGLKLAAAAAALRDIAHAPGATPALQAACAYFLERVEPKARFCAYQAQRRAGAEGLARLEAALAALETRPVEGGLTGTTTQPEAAPDSETVPAVTTFAWGGWQVSVKDARVGAELYKAERADREAREDAMEGTGAALLERHVAATERAINAYGSARAAARAAAALGGDVEGLELLSRAVQGRVLDLTLERGGAVLRLADARRTGAARRRLANASASQLPGRQGTSGRPEESVRALDSLLEAAQQLHDLAVELGGALGEGVMDRAAALKEQYTAERCAAVGHMSLFAGSWSEAASLFARAGELATRAIRAHEDCERVDATAVAELRALQASVRAFRAVAAAELAAEGVAAAEGVSDRVADLTLDELANEPGSIRFPEFLVDDLDAPRAFVAEGKASARIARIPPAPEPMPVRPIVLDAALSYITVPTLDHRLGKKAGASGISRLFGWGGR